MGLKLMFVALAAMIAGCAGPDLPVVDLEGKNPVQVNRDMATCQTYAAGGGWGNPIASCMVGKGYTLMGTYASYNRHDPNSSNVVLVPE